MTNSLTMQAIYDRISARLDLLLSSALTPLVDPAIEVGSLPIAWPYLGVRDGTRPLLQKLAQVYYKVAPDAYRHSTAWRDPRQSGESAARGRGCLFKGLTSGYGEVSMVNRKEDRTEDLSRPPPLKPNPQPPTSQLQDWAVDEGLARRNAEATMVRQSFQPYRTRYEGHHVRSPS